MHSLSFQVPISLCPFTLISTQLSFLTILLCVSCVSCFEKKWNFNPDKHDCAQDSLSHSNFLFGSVEMSTNAEGPEYCGLGNEPVLRIRKIFCLWRKCKKFDCWECNISLAIFILMKTCSARHLTRVKVVWQSCFLSPEICQSMWRVMAAMSSVIVIHSVDPVTAWPALLSQKHFYIIQNTKKQNVSHK
jgi:hypothetical protein